MEKKKSSPSTASVGSDIEKDTTVATKFLIVSQLTKSPWNRAVLPLLHR